MINTPALLHYILEPILFIMYINESPFNLSKSPTVLYSNYQWFLFAYDLDLCIRDGLELILLFVNYKIKPSFTID